MPVLADGHSKPALKHGGIVSAESLVEGSDSSAPGWGLIGTCSNPGCDSGWFHLFRRRSRPVFEGGWTCSPECTRARLQAAVRREIENRSPREGVHHHRIPIGLLMLEKGWITAQQLRTALEAQRASRSGRLGQWLVRQGAADEGTVTRALAVQWSCPVLSIDPCCAGTLAGVMPRLFIDAFGALPTKVAAGKILYLGFEESLDPVLALGVERITGLPVESGVVPSSLFRPALGELLAGSFAAVQLAEATSEAAAAHLMAKAVERAQPADARLVRVHDFLWMRMFLSRSQSGAPGISSVSDVICTIKAL